MAIITNQCDVLLQATTPRMLNVSSNFITVTPTTNAFSTTATSTSPSSIAVRASLSGELRGTVTWSTVPTVAFTVAGNILTLPATSVAAGSTVTVTATLTLYGQTYTSSANISHQADTVTSSLSSSAVTISTNTDGTGGTYTGATSTMSVTIGILDDSANWTYAWTVPAGVTATGQATRTIAVSAMTVDNATLTCTATRAGWATQTKSFTISKSKNGSIGTNGVDAITINYTNDSLTVPQTNAGVSTWTGSGGILQVYEGVSALTYLSTGNAQSVTTPSTNGNYVINIARVSGDNLTEPTITGTGTTSVTLSDWAGTLTTATVYRITAYIKTLSGSSVTVSTDVSISPSKAGADSTIYYIDTSSPVLTKTSPDAVTTGTYSSISIQGKKVAGTTITNYGWVTITANGGTEATSATNTATAAVTLAPTTTAGTSSYTIKMYNQATVAGAILLDTEIVNVVFKGATGAASTVPGPTGKSARICYSKTTLATLATTPTTITTGPPGSTSFPPNGSWDTTNNATIWQATAPTIVAGESVYQSDGIFDPVTDRTIWNVPYLSNLKVGKLESITSSTGKLTVSTDGHIKGGQTDYDTGTGFFLGWSTSGTSAYKFSIGNPTSSATGSSLTWDGTNFKLKNAVFQGYSNNSFKIGSTASGNLMSLLASSAPVAAPLVFWSDTSSSSYPFFDVTTNSSDSTTGAAIDFSSSDAGAIALVVTQSGSGGGAAKFFNTPSSKQFWAAPGGYSAYSPSGGGKIYITDGNGPFTGFHDTLTLLDEAVEVGDIMVDTKLVYKSGISSTLFETKISSQPMQATVIGIASDIVPVEKGTPSTLWSATLLETSRGVTNTWSMPSGFNFEEVASTYKVVQVNALGEGQINVCGIGGNIAAGDYIVTSTIRGKGMRQADDLVHNYTVAKARESVTFNSPTEVKMIACIYLCG